MTAERFREFAAREDAELDLAEGALLIATEAYPDLDVESYLDRLDTLADEAEASLPAEPDALATVIALSRYLYTEQGFGGNAESYYDERNSFLCDVLDRRLGIPITLATVYLEVAHRLRVPIEGVNFPTHFLLRHATAPEILIDPFEGSVIDEETCAERLRAALGDNVELEDDHFRTASPREMLFRMLGNLKQIYVNDGEHEKALSCSDRALMLMPEDWLERRDRGLLYARLECWQAALADLEPFARVAGPELIRPSFAKTLDEIRAKARLIH